MSPHRHIAAVFALALILGCPTITWSATAAPPQRDLWYSIRDGEQRFGFVHITVGRLGDGTLEYNVETRMKVEMLGARQEHGFTAQAIVDAGFAPRRLESTLLQMSGVARVTGSATDEGFVVESEEDGRSRRSVLSFDDEMGLLFDVTLNDWLHQLPHDPAQPPTQRRVRVLSTQSGSPIEVLVRDVERGDDGSTWLLEPEGGVGASTLRLDAEGLLIEQVVHTPSMRVERSSREEAIQFEHRRMPDRELLIFTPDQPLPPMHRLNSVSIELTWSGIPLDEFELSDSRQRIVSHAVEEGRHTAVVVLERPGDLRCDFTIPATAARFEASLAETELLRPRDERIAATAREIVGDETSALAATRAICRWVSEHIEPAMIAETLSGSEVLERRTGKCSEYTTLFGSLARSAGIPTRIALGQRRFNGSWGGHMWNEVFIGEWIPVDASVNEVGGSPALLKFIHSDTVTGTQPIRWKLTESLEIAIPGFELVPRADGEEQLTTGVVNGVYTNAEYGFRITLPTEQWSVKDAGPPSSLLLRLRPPDERFGNSLQIHLAAFPAGAGLSPRAVVTGRMNHHRASLREFEVMRDEAIKVGEADGLRIQFRGVPDVDGGVPMRVTEFFWIGDEKGFLLNLIATEELHDAYRDRLEAIVGSFERVAE